MILMLDEAGAPSNWISALEAAPYYFKDLVAWEAGESSVTLHGGVNARSGERSILEVNSIIAIRGASFSAQNYGNRIAVNRQSLFRRDKCMCAYCGEVFKESELTLEHILPEAQGGRTSWTNLVAACKSCNHKKGNRTPEQAKMPLIYVPYVPNKHEILILANRKILADQMEFLMQGVSRNSRLH